MADSPGQRILADGQFAAIADLDHPLNIGGKKVIKFHLQHRLRHRKNRNQAQLWIKQMETSFRRPNLMVKSNPDIVPL